MSEDSACTALDPRVKVSEFKLEDMQFFPPVWAVISEGPEAVEITSLQQCEHQDFLWLQCSLSVRIRAFPAALPVLFSGVDLCSNQLSK